MILSSITRGRVGRRAGRLAILSIFCGLAVGLAAASVARAQRPSEREIARLMAEGRLDEAQQLINRHTDDPVRQAAMRIRLSDMYAERGQFDRAVAASSMIPDDRVRSAAFERIRQARGGAIGADFDTVIELIQNTVVPDSWEEWGGLGTIEPFPTGVLVDLRSAPGMLEEATLASAERPTRPTMMASPIPLRPSPRRCVSLKELERQMQIRWAMGLRPTRSMEALAGLYRIDQIYIDRENRDVLIIGPAAPWRWDEEGRPRQIGSDQPVLWLEDLVGALRLVTWGPGQFSVAIKPRPENLEKLVTFLEQSRQRPLRPGERSSWVRRIRETVGTQVVEHQGSDPTSHLARVLFEADHHMKQIGMGLVDGGPLVPSYLDLIDLGPGESPPSMEILRWWFTLTDEPLRSDPERQLFEIPRQAVQVLSENQMMTRRGERVPTGESEPLNREFAANFTRHYNHLAEQFPIYAELNQVFQLALLGAVLRHEDVSSQVGWYMSHWRDPKQFDCRRFQPQMEVDSIVNHRLLPGRIVIVGVSGGVLGDPLATLATSVTPVEGLADSTRPDVSPTDPLDFTRPWWWEW